MNARAIFGLAVGATLVVAWYAARFEGEPRPVEPVQVFALPEIPVWRGQPALLRKTDEPAAIYVLVDGPGPDGQFNALRLDLTSGARSSMQIAIGPATSFRPFERAQSAGTANIELHGVLLRRPTPYLFRLPGPGGPALDLVDSATGVLQVVAGTGATMRTLLHLTVINSSRMEEVRSQLWSDRSKSIAAFSWPHGDGWRLYVFALQPAQAPASPRLPSPLPSQPRPTPTQ